MQGDDGAPGAAGTEDSVGAESVLSVGSSERVDAMYRVGYRSRATDGTRGDWAVPGSEPPDAITSDFMPVSGLCDSTNRSIPREHLNMIAGSFIGVVSVLWRGSDSVDAPVIIDVLDEAELRGLKVSFALEFPAGGLRVSGESDPLSCIERRARRRRPDELPTAG